MSEDDTPESTAPPTAVLPLDAWHRAQGARMVAFAGYHMPIQYDGILAEHLWTRAHAGLFDVSHMGQLTLAGAGADAALETVLPGELIALKLGRMRYSLLLDATGGILDDLMATRLPAANPFGVAEGDFYVVVNGATKFDDIAYLHEALPEGVTLNHRDEQALLALQGPEAAAALARLVPGAGELGFMQAGQFPLEGTTAWISRSGYTGEDGFEISIPAAAAEAVAARLAAQPEVRPIGLGARDSLRLEAGLPLYGHDLNETIDPVAAGLTFAIGKRRRAEGGFAGAERILRALTEGAPARRVGFAIEGRLPAREHAPVFADAEQVGEITSGGFAPSVGAPIAMGYVDAAYAATGTPLAIEVRGKRIAATVADMPFVVHNYHRKGAA